MRRRSNQDCSLQNLFKDKIIDNITIDFLQKYTKSKDYNPELVKEYFLKLTEEVGELSRAIRKNLRPCNETQIKETVEEEL